MFKCKKINIKVGGSYNNEKIRQVKQLNKGEIFHGKIDTCNIYQQLFFKQLGHSIEKIDYSIRKLPQMNYNKVFLNVWVTIEFKALDIKNGTVIYFCEEVQVFYFLVDQ